MKRRFLLAVCLGISFSQAHGAVSGTTPPPEGMLKLRDPFKRPDIEIAKIEPKSELERYSVDSYKMVAVLTGPNKMRAMLQDPAGATHLVSENMKIGLRRGVIKKITTDTVFVREKVINVLGQEENLDLEIKLPVDKNFSRADARSGR